MTGMSNHIAIGVVHSRMPIAPRLKLIDQPVGNLGGLHPRSFLEWPDIRGNFDVGLDVGIECATSIAVPEISDMAEFLGLTDRELWETSPRNVFTERSIDLGWHHQIEGR